MISMRSIFFSLALLILSAQVRAHAADLGDSVRNIYTIDGIELGRSKFADLIKKWGGKPTSKSGNQYFCYVISKPKKIYVVFGGSADWEILDTVFLSYNRFLPPYLDCSSTKLEISRSPITKNGLTLGLSRSAVTAILGEPAKNKQFSLERYCWESAVKLPEVGPTHENSAVVIKYAQDVVNEMQITLEREAFSEQARKDKTGSAAREEIKSMYGRSAFFRGKPNRESCYQNFIENDY